MRVLGKYWRSLVGAMDKEAFRIVYRILVNNEKFEVNAHMLKRCIDAAAKNKVLLHFLRMLNVYNSIRFHEETKYRIFLRNLHIVAESLNNLNYVFIKFRKPIVYVPSDIDILINRDDIEKAINRLGEKGFRIKIIEPYCITMVCKNSIVDFYVYPTIGGMIYLDAEKLIEHSEYISFNGLKIPVLKTYAEVLMTITHAIYKERIYTLNDYIVARTWFSEEVIDLARELSCINALEKALTIHRLVERQNFILPHKIPLAEWTSLLGSKILYDKLSRTTFFNFLKTFKDLRFGRLILSKLMRETY